MPATSSGSRVRANRCSSACGSHDRKRGQARVQRGAALLAVDAVVGAELVLEVERLVGAGLVRVADDVVRARDDAAGAAGAQARLDDLGVQLLPLRRPARGLGGGRGGLGHGHARKRTWPSTAGALHRSGVTRPPLGLPHGVAVGTLRRRRHAASSMGLPRSRPRPAAPPTRPRPVGPLGRLAPRRDGPGGSAACSARAPLLSSVSLLASAVVAYGWYEWRSVDRVGVDTDDAPAGDPVNILLVGSDSREGEGADEEAAVQGKRTDTIMIAAPRPAVRGGRTSSRSPATCGCRSPARASRPASTRPTTRRASSRCWSTRSATTSASRSTTGSRSTSPGSASWSTPSAGVTLYFDRGLRDPAAGLYIDQLGCVTLDGEMALAYARSRKAEYHTDDGWVRDPQSDLSRIVRQQTLMSEALDEVVREADNPVRLRELVDIGTVQRQHRLGADARRRPRAGRPVPRPRRRTSFHTMSLPVLPRPGDEDSTVVVDEQAAEPVLNIFRGLDPGEVSPANIEVVGAQRHGRRPGPAAGRAGRRRHGGLRDRWGSPRGRRRTPTSSTRTRPSCTRAGGWRRASAWPATSPAA